ncbi:hypothetical protein FDX19_11555 [Citrobacter sp. wls619]|uniref:hypothetical protein n=1 Tax=Citrobacter sp. wls619 TaxID=2576432 RepID=UPI0010C9B613|nr:hypothetical protein [Citrobacter sp. wls619]TKV10296.1 hypothetical protein FDX19_11555 [Citrobacter sp. wls619]
MERVNILRVVICVCFLMSGCAKKNIPDVVKNPPQGQVSCYQSITTLKVLDKKSFDVYKKQFDKINELYVVYNKQKSQLDSESAEIIKLEVNNKLMVVCSRVRNAVFNVMNQQASELDKL